MAPCHQQGVFERNDSIASPTKIVLLGGYKAQSDPRYSDLLTTDNLAAS
ncbi:MAG: hypothetical protein AB4352_22980 [Hormoscilla sp.]